MGFFYTFSVAVPLRPLRFPRLKRSHPPRGLKPAAIDHSSRRLVTRHLGDLKPKKKNINLGYHQQVGISPTSWDITNKLGYHQQVGNYF